MLARRTLKSPLSARLRRPNGSRAQSIVEALVRHDRLREARVREHRIFEALVRIIAGRFFRGAARLRPARLILPLLARVLHRRPSGLGREQFVDRLWRRHRRRNLLGRLPDLRAEPNLAGLVEGAARIRQRRVPEEGGDLRIRWRRP
jgi:hypothetical protein